MCCLSEQQQQNRATILKRAKEETEKDTANEATPYHPLDDAPSDRRSSPAIQELLDKSADVAVADHLDTSFRPLLGACKIGTSLLA